LATRGRIRDAIRRYFVQNGFAEVECGALQVSPGNEAHLHAFETQSIATDGSRQRLYLHTSPEFACKKLLAAGERRIFTFAPVYRNRERGDLHAPEFTMLEWYRAQESYDIVVSDCLDLLKAAAAAVPSEILSFRGRACDPFREPERLTVSDAFERFAGIDLLSTLDAQGDGDRETLAAATQA